MKPENEKQLAEIIRSANGPLCITGGGTRGLKVDGEALETGAMSGIKLYEPGALTMVAGAGTPLSEIEGALEAEGQMLAFEPYDLSGVTDAKGASTIGGVFATNTSGPRRVQVGAARDFLLGARFVDGSGNIIKNGGRVMKNVTGYDLVKLMAGSHGTLGVMSEVSFKVLPKPECVGTLVSDKISPEAAVGAMAAASGSPFDVSGASYDLKNGKTVIRVEGFEVSVSYRLERLKTLLGGFGEFDSETDPDQLSSLEELADGRDLWRIACKPTDAPVLASKLGSAPALFDWAGGRIWVGTAAGSDLRAALGKFDGHATLVATRSESDLPRFHPEPAPIARLTANLRVKFDPKGILNTGLMG